MDVRGLFLAVLTVSWAAVCYAEDSDIAKLGLDDDDAALVEDEVASAVKRLFPYGRDSIHRYNRAPTVFRYGKRSPVFRYGKRADEDVDAHAGVDAMKRIFRWGKRADDDVAKRIFRWGKRTDADDEAIDAALKRSPVFRYGKRGDSMDDYNTEAEKRRIFNFGKREQGNNIDLRADSPHVPFRFGDDRK